MTLCYDCKTFTAKNDSTRSLRYIECKPDGAAGKLPLIFKIHGAGAMGSFDDFDALIGREPAYFSALQRGISSPAIILKPHSGVSTWFDVFETLLEFVDTMSLREDVDSSRIYCIGASMGGYTTWQLGMSRPELFAAIVPICGGGMYWNAAKLKNTPIWAFHGALDRTVLVEESLKMVRAVNECGGDARITVYPHAQHDAWTPTYSNDEMWQWLFARKRSV